VRVKEIYLVKKELKLKDKYILNLLIKRYIKDEISRKLFQNSSVNYTLNQWEMNFL
jgi:hypothetical protein